MPLFRTAVFHTTVADLCDLPTDAQYEVAFAGRSNAGKSSAINTLADHSRLAFVSKTPGRTQHLNYFRLADGKYFVDLPGYGFARAPEAIRGQWEGLLAPYLQNRPALRGLVLIMDCRNPLTELDLQMLDWFAQTGKPVHVLLSKADKLGWQAQCQALRAVEQALLAFGDNCSAQMFSSLKKTGVQAAESVLAGWLEMAPEVEKLPPTGLRSAKTARVRPRSAIGWGARQNAAKR